MTREGVRIFFGLPLVWALTACGAAQPPAGRALQQPQKTAVAETTAADIVDIDDAPRVSKPQHGDDGTLRESAKTEEPRRSDRRRTGGIGGFSGYK